MTTEEAIRRISEYIYACDDNAISVEAGEMAISALSAIEDIKAEIKDMPEDFDISQTDEWNSKSLYCVISRCSKWAVEIIDKHISGKVER